MLMAQRSERTIRHTCKPGRNWIRPAAAGLSYCLRSAAAMQLLHVHKEEVHVMSHIVQIQTDIRDPVAIPAACERLQLPAPVFGETNLFSGSATGHAVRLPGWRHRPSMSQAISRSEIAKFRGKTRHV